MNDLTIGGLQFHIHQGIVRILALRNQFTDELSDPGSIINEIKERSLPVDLLTFIQQPPNTSPMFRYYMQWDNLAVLTISTYEDWLKKQIHQNTRNKIRKAEKSGVTVNIEPLSDRLVEGLVGLFNETPVRRGKQNFYYGRNSEKVKREWATELDRSLWLVASYKEEMIGFIKLVLSDRLARTSGTVAKDAHREKAPMNALFAKSVEVCASRGIPLLVYGRFVYGRKGEDSLTTFKKYNGFQRLDVPRYYVPLSMRGRIALRLGLHQRPYEMIPGPALRLLLKTRSRWYDVWRKKRGGD